MVRAVKRWLRMRRDFTFYGVLLAVGLGLAYYTSLPTGDKDSTRVDWAKLDPKSVTEIDYVKGANKAILTRVGEGFWVHYEQPAPKDPTGKILGSGTQEFKANADRMRDILAA